MATLRDYIRNQSGSFTAKEILKGYQQLKPTIKLDSVNCQLNRLVEKGELKKEKVGRLVTFTSRAPGMSSLFNSLLKQCRMRTNP